MPVLENLHIFLIWGMDSEFTMLWFYGEKNNIKNQYIRAQVEQFGAQVREALDVEYRTNRQGKREEHREYS